FPHFMSVSNPGPMFMMLVAIVFSFLIAYIAQRGVNGSTGVSIVINVVQITALLVFTVFALMYRSNHPAGSVAYQFDAASENAYSYQFATQPPTAADGQAGTVVLRDARGVPLPKLDAAGHPVPFRISYPKTDASGNF